MNRLDKAILLLALLFASCGICGVVLNWVDGGPEMFVREIEQAADRVVEGVHFPVSQARRRKTGSALRIELGI